MQKKIPQRQCMGCRERMDKKALIRVVRGTDGNVSLDFSGKLAGRGAYICPKADCLKKAQKSQALMNMGKLGILELKDACYRDLSGGQQQRVLLARALCAATELLILDEPITGLDPAAAQDLYKILTYLNEKEGMAVVMVTHDLKSALRGARTVLLMEDGSAILISADNAGFYVP
jgi:ABC-type Mn2+/Zn2+ transport system ATPase subunit